jgi:hypothetical protein
MIIDVLHSTSIATTLSIFVIRLPFQIIDVHDSFSLFPPFFVTIIWNLQLQTFSLAWNLDLMAFVLILGVC